MKVYKAEDKVGNFLVGIGNILSGVLSVLTFGFFVWSIDYDIVFWWALRNIPEEK